MDRRSRPRAPIKTKLPKALPSPRPPPPHKETDRFAWPAKSHAGEMAKGSNGTTQRTEIALRAKAALEVQTADTKRK